MKRLCTPILLLLLAALAAACSDGTGISDAVDEDPETSAFAGKGKPVSGGGDSQSRARITFTDEESFRIVSDDRGAYQGDQEGVHATILYHDPDRARGGSLIFDPDKNSFTPPRKVRITFSDFVSAPAADTPRPPYPPSPSYDYYDSGAYLDLKGLMQVTCPIGGTTTCSAPPAYTGDPPVYTVDDWIAEQLPDADLRYLRENPAVNDQFGHSTDWRLTLTGTGIPNCEKIVFEQVQISRAAGVFDTVIGKWSSDPLQLGTWTVESVGGDLATCYYVGAKNKLYEGARYKLPFQMTVVEVRN